MSSHVHKRGSRRAVLAGVLVASCTAAVASFVVTAAPAAPSVPAPSAPTITGHPVDPTSSARAFFTYHDASSGVSFQCQLDSESFSSCSSSGTSYSSLRDGTHTFRVRAQQGKGSSSAPTSFTWNIDTRPPLVRVSFPRDGGAYNATGWQGGCTVTGVCGTVTDSSGVASVRVSIERKSTGRFWSGSSFSSKSEAFVTAAGTSSWSYPLALPPDGSYSLTVVATDRLGNSTRWSDAPRLTFRVDTVPPPAPKLTEQPKGETSKTSTEFELSDAEHGVGFRCSLDAGPFAWCTGDTDHDGDRGVPGEIEYKNLAPGHHCFSAVAVDEAGNQSAVTMYCWTISGGTGLPFVIAGTIVPDFFPGMSQPLNLVFTNPNGSPITISTVGVTVDPVTTKASCNGTANMSVTHGLMGSVVVPANATKSLSDLGVPTADWPVLSMPDLASNQDACQGARFTLHFTGSAAG